MHKTPFPSFRAWPGISSCSLTNTSGSGEWEILNQVQNDVWGSWVKLILRKKSAAFRHGHQSEEHFKYFTSAGSMWLIFLWIIPQFQNSRSSNCIQLNTALFRKMKSTTPKVSNVNNPVQMSETNAARGYEKTPNDFGGKFAVSCACRRMQILWQNQCCFFLREVWYSDLIEFENG